MGLKKSFPKKSDNLKKFIRNGIDVGVVYQTNVGGWTFFIQNGIAVVMGVGSLKPLIPISALTISLVIHVRMI